MVISLSGEDSDQQARVVGNPIKLRHAERKRHRFPPRLGADTRDILGCVLEYPAERIAELIERKVVGEAAARTSDARPSSAAGRKVRA
jgi:crotonobetainyl-CoA:carnitine CoA-transferase CaiB-like acyl-CoA transferase